MPERNTITKKQRAVIEDLFAVEADEQQVLDRHKVSRKTYQKWQTDELFLKALELRLKQERRQSDLVITRYATFAAAKLIQLTESQNQETARKACLDIITLLRPDPKRPDLQADDPANPPTELPPDVAARLLSALAANEKND